MPDFPNLFLIYKFSRLEISVFQYFYHCLSLRKLGSHLGFLWTELRIGCFSSSSGTNASRPASFISWFILFFNIFSYCDTTDSSVQFPLGVPEESIVPEKRWCETVSLPSSCCKIVALLQSSPCLQRALPRVGNNVVRLVTRESHKCCMHLLQNERQVCTPRSWFVAVGRNSRSMSSVLISVTCSAAHSNIISDSLITSAKNASVLSPTTVGNPPPCQRIPSDVQDLSNQ